MNYDINILLLDKTDKLYNKLKNNFKLENIGIGFTKDLKEAIEYLDKETIYLIIANCLVEDISDLVIASKTSDIFRPIIILDANDQECRRDLVRMGVNIFYGSDFDIREMTTQSLNLITLYQAKKDSKSQNDVFKTLSLALEVRDPYTHGHGERVAAYTTVLYDKLGFRDFEDRELLRAGCLIHDVGKIGTPDNILKSDKKLNNEEFGIIKNHPQDGVKICFKIISNPKVVDIIEHHHEKLDGSGYPHGLKGDEISHMVQMTTISDMYDALTSDRSYRIRNTTEEAIKIMEDYFVGTDKINAEYFAVFKQLLADGVFDSLKYI